MEPMKPMKPMAPMSFDPPWWPEDLGSPSTSGAQNGMRYAVFPDKQRLVIETEGRSETYDTADHRIGGVSQSDGGSRTLTFSSQHGPIELGSLRKLG